MLNVAEVAATHCIPEPPAPCGWCRRCLLHDDPGGCLEVDAWAQAHPVFDAIFTAAWEAES